MPVNRTAAPGSDGDVPRPWAVYLVRCADGTLYAGATNDVGRRLRRHAAGQVKYTRGRLPVALAWCEVVGARGEALRREAALKRLTRRQKLALIAHAEAAGTTLASLLREGVR